MKTPVRTKIAPFACWIASAIGVSAAFGVLNDQITVTLSPEYFSVFKMRQFASILGSMGLGHSPTRIQAIAVGALSTWWLGLILGIALSACGLLGSRPRISTRTYLRSVLGIVILTLGLSALGGVIGYATYMVLQPTAADWPFLEDIRDPPSAFAVGFWHDTAYFGATLGAVFTAWRFNKQRSRPQ